MARQQFILFDEPTNVDAASKLQLKRSLKELTRSLSQTIVYVTHDQTEAMTLADQIALMEEGKIVQCAARELYNHPYDRRGLVSRQSGMVFFLPHSRVATITGCWSLLFPRPVAVNGAATAGSDITIGIRPEHPGLAGLLPAGVPARLARKTVQIGGQYLVALDVHGLGIRDSSQSLPDRGRALALIGTGQRRVAARAGVALRRGPDRGRSAPRRGTRRSSPTMARLFSSHSFPMNQTTGPYSCWHGAGVNSSVPYLSPYDLQSSLPRGPVPVTGLPYSTRCF